VDAPWQALAGIEAGGYEIHHGATRQHAGMAAARELAPGLAWQSGNVLGVYLHGLFEDPAVLRALFGAQARTLDAVFDGLADFVDAHFAPGVLERLVAGKPR
jgi:adenosylcobyric acid synthase